MFSGNTALLVASPTLQDYLVDKTTGTPLAAGIVTFYEDSQRQTLKNVYYQQGTPGAYTYTALPNPLTLSAVGTIQDSNGNDVIPFFYPYDEDDNVTPQPYYVTVFNSSLVAQFTRQNFPFVPPSSTPSGGSPAISNYLTNNVFWRNSGNTNLTSQTNFVLAPGNHDGFTNPDIRFIKSKTGGADSVAYASFGSTLLPSDVTPEYYAHMVCSGATTGETQKCIQFPIQLHVANLQNAQMISSIWAMGTGTITVYLYQFLGTGASSQPAPVLQGTGSITLNSTWTQYPVPVVFPSLILPVSGTGDDAFYLQIELPHNENYDISIAKPSLYLGSEIPSSQYSSYDQIDAVIGTPRTGDIRLGLNTFSYITPYFGWLPMNDGNIGNASSSATTRANIDAWQLFSTLYLNVSDSYAPVSGGRTAPGNTLATAYADWTLNKTIGLTKTLGRVLASVGLPSSGNNVGTTWALGQTTGNETQTISISNMPSHNHPGSIFPFTIFNASSGGTPVCEAGGSATSLPVTVASQGGGTAFNIQDPVTYLNVFIKL